MRKHLITRFNSLAIAGLLIVTLTVFSSGQSAQGPFAAPKKLSLDRAVRALFPGYFRRQRYPQLYAEGFFPIGWSRDGKFAYYTEPVDEACGCYFARLIIQDLRTDKVLWEFKFNQDDEMRNGGNRKAEEDTIQKLWAKNKNLFSEKLRENGIEASPGFVLLARTFTSSGRSYTAAVTAPPGRDDDGLDRVKSVTLSLSTPKLGKKILYSADYKTNMYSSPLDAGVAGVFKSPFEDRVAVIMIEADRGYEGPPGSANVHIVGADLTSGFRKAR